MKYPPLTKKETEALIQFYNNPLNRQTLAEDLAAIREGCNNHNIDLPVWAEIEDKSNE